MLKPNYHDGSLVNLTSSILQAFGGKSQYDPLKILPPQQITNPKTVVLFLIDGLGMEFLRNYATGSVIHRYLKGEITSVFPSTTASAITTIMTGLAPQQHGITGWFTYFEQLDEIALVLPYITRKDRKKIKVHPSTLLPFKTVYQQINRKSYCILPKGYLKLGYNKAACAGATLVGYRSIAGLFHKLKQLCQQDHPKYIYAYWPLFDDVCHAKGYNSKEAREHFRHLNDYFKKLVKHLKGTDTTLLITADHGQMELEQGLMMQPEKFHCSSFWGEPRAVFCIVEQKYQLQFEQFCETKLKKYAVWYRSSDLLEQGYFGLGKAHPAIKHRIGTHILLPKQNYALRDFMKKEKQHFFRGNHGGLSREELIIPLSVIHT
ncbi:alkaline phosphatase family protein [Candidatus Woesearchaeota archaeon]|nr:alkaline phosphatase family protein [Candidatus Woesearchaeota archaeon]